jgi:hypothetical protein
MKNLIFAKASLFLLGGLMIASSCKKIENPEAIQVVDESKTATVKGIVYADLIDTNSVDEFAPVGTTLLVSINSSDFPGSTGSQTLLYKTTVGANGEYTINVPAPTSAITARVMPQEFRTSRIDWRGTSEMTKFEANSFNVSIVQGGTSIHDFWYYY